MREIIQPPKERRMDVYDHMARALAFCRAAKLVPELLYPADAWQDEDVVVHLTAEALLRLAGDGLTFGEESYGSIHAGVSYDGIRFVGNATPEEWEAAILVQGADGKGFPESVQASGGDSTFGGAVVAGSPNGSE